MAEITALMVKDLRNKTGAGMADCKKALEEAEGEMEKAIEVLRKKGAASASKRSDRSTNEGFCATRVSADNKTAALIAVTCETDFVARNQEFIDFVNVVADTFISSNATALEDLLKQSAGNSTIQNLFDEILTKFSEKIEIAKCIKMSTDGYYNVYVHFGSKLAVIVELGVSSKTDRTETIAKDIAMQIAAMNPMFVDRSQVTAEILKKEIEIYTEQAVTEGKKPELAEKIAQGRVEKFYKESCLVEQAFVKDPNKTITDVVKELGADAKVNSFIRYAIGE